VAPIRFFNKSFYLSKKKDHETAFLELKKMLFQSFYTWIVAFISLFVSNFSEF
jgi:hypothetical protein